MIEYGRSIRWFNNYRGEVEFSESNKFDFMQIWFKKGDLILDKINYTPNDLKVVFDRNPDVELLLDIAHIDDYKHLQEILEVKFPKCLHIADKRFSEAHEHLPIGEGDLDFELIFQNYLKGYDGKIIFEVVDTDEKIIRSKNIIQSILNKTTLI